MFLVDSISAKFFCKHKLWGNLYDCFEMRRKWRERGVNLGYVGNSACGTGEGGGASYLSWWFCLIPSESGISRGLFFLRKAVTVGLADSFQKPVSMRLK